MKLMKTMLLVLPAYVLLTACGTRPDPSAVTRSSSAASAKTSDQTQNGTSSTSPSAAPVNVADLQQKQSDLLAQKTNLLTQQKNMQGQQSAFALPANVKGQAFGDFMANAQALPAAIDQAKVDKIIQAAQDLDLDALQKAVADLLTDLQDLIADLQDQIDDLAAQIQAAGA